MKIGIPEMGDQWMKMEMSEEMWEAQSQIDQQVELLKTAEAVNFLGSENVNGTKCYVVEIMPSVEALGNMLSQYQLPDIGNLDSLDLDLTNLIKEMSIKEWIAEDSYLFMKSETYVVMEMAPGALGATEDDFENMSININTVVELYGYNEAVTIVLPAGASAATVME